MGFPAKRLALRDDTSAILSEQQTIYSGISLKLRKVIDLMK